VRTAADGARALAIARAECPLIVFADWKPELDGLRLIETVLADAPGAMCIH
jgi:YesN/AraC family two-component response regulator